MYAVKDDGSFRHVDSDMDLIEDETFYEVLPQWVLDKLSEWRRANFG